MKPWLLITVGIVIVGVVLGKTSTAEDLTPEMVRKAIADGVAYLKERQRPDGSWPDMGEVVLPSPQQGGVSALCTLALLSAGVRPEDEHIRRALTYLEKLPLLSTYVVSLQTLVFCQANPKQYLTLIQRNVRWLEEKQIKSGPNKGAWSYPGVPGAQGDNSNSQFALLALHEAERAGATVRRETWTLARRYWEEAQRPDGSWGYHRKGSNILDTGTGSMTCAGIASLIICSGKFRQPNARASGDDILCCQQAEDEESDRIQNGLAWLARNFSVTGNPGAPGRMWLLYYLYALERVGRLTNQRFIGQHDWYREGTAHLMSRYSPLRRHWTGIGRVEEDPHVGTAFALLFLAKGRRPVILAKLQHPPANDWNAHRSDVDNLTHYVESRWKTELTWQVTDVSRASVEDLLQSPVLYYCGREDPRPPGAVDKQLLGRKLRDYLDRGGFIFAEGWGSGFDHGFRELMTQVFPEPEYRLRPLEPEHPIWRFEEAVPAEHQRPLWGIDFGCRTSVVYAAMEPVARTRPSLSCLWELARPDRDTKLPASVQAQIVAGLSIGINVLAYATNRELRGGEEVFRPAAARSITASGARGTIHVAKLRHPGGCNAAPRALANLLETAAAQLRLRTSSEQRLINISDDSLFDYHLVFMHGRNSFRLTEAERKQLRAYVERGGMLFADAICGSPAFVRSFRDEMAAIFPNQKLQRLAADDPLLTSRYGGFDLQSVSRREPLPRDSSGPMRASLRRVPPELEGIKFDDRWGVLFSPHDLSCALEKHESPDCRGYSREDAARLGLNILLYSLQQ